MRLISTPALEKLEILVYAEPVSRICVVELTSTRNPLLQKIRRAATTGHATENGLIVAEGPHLLTEALRGRWAIEQIFVTAHVRENLAELFEKTDAEVIEVSERALASASATDAPQNILSLLRPSKWSWHDLLASADGREDRALLVVLDRIQDPGNAGTIVRSAEAFGATGLVFLKGCARVANGKLLRAASGSLFRMPFLEDIAPKDLLKQVQAFGLKLFALTARGRTSLALTPWGDACALLVGNEGSGVSSDLLALAEGVSVPTTQVESLNAAVACSLALYEARQHRRRA